MSIRSKLTKFILGTNPNSLANLKQNQVSTDTVRKQNDEDFIDKMQRYEKLRQDIYNTEQNKRSSIMQELQDQLGDDDDGEEGDDNQALAMFQQFMGLYSQQGGQAVPAQGSSIPDAPQPVGISDNDIANIVATIQAEHPKILHQVRKGKISQEQAISFLKLRGINEADAQRIYQEAMR